MGGDSEYEPKDSRNITGTAKTPDGHFTGDRQKPGHGGEYEPRDSRNVTGTAQTTKDRWSNESAKPPAGVPDSAPVDASDASDNPHGEATRDLDRERLEPGFNTDGKGDVGKRPPNSE